MLLGLAVALFMHRARLVPDLALGLAEQSGSSEVQQQLDEVNKRIMDIQLDLLHTNTQRVVVENITAVSLL